MSLRFPDSLWKERRGRGSRRKEGEGKRREEVWRGSQKEPKYAQSWQSRAAVE